jgi:hypothetical protein
MYTMGGELEVLETDVARRSGGDEVAGLRQTGGRSVEDVGNPAVVPSEFDRNSSR